MSIKQKAVKGVVWSVIQNWGSQAVSLIVFLILARLLTPEAFGLVALANVFLAFMQIFTEQGFTKALIQRSKLEPEHLDTAFWSNLIGGVLLTIIGFLGAKYIAGIFAQPKLIPILKCLCFLFFVNSIGHVHKAILSRELAFKIMAVRTLIAIFISGLVGIIMAVAGLGVWSIVSQQMVFESVVVLIMWQAVDWRPSFKFSGQHFRDLFSFGINIIGLKFLKFFNKRSDNLLIGYFLGEVALGYYAIAYRVLQVMTQLLIGTSNQVALPTFSKLQEEPERFRQAFYRVTELTSLVAFPAFVGMATLTPELVVSVFGEQWISSIPVMRVLAFAGIIHSLSYFNTSVFMAMGKPIWKLWLTLFEAIFTLIACLLVVKWGIAAVACAYVISIYLVFPIGLGAINRVIGVPILIYLQQFVTPAIATLIMAAVIFLTKYFLVEAIDAKILLIVGTVIGVITYGLAIQLLNPKLFQYLLQLLLMVRSRKKLVK
ncbi:lipopolysaccharide biosynthesis protein [Oscillatoria salina]|uniref:lipopolysaccharide biosynthesis protein n=1 Tax=Oscillatoria salina TaxID=331517 RepID=UPI0013BCAAB2|nr:lipopolysaccharide biosynthesis protein [Oscillatoria salina]MBZ8180599.1 lipopolysaccharide biosynthesis protein [Oscillatoria salina IIICB1]NET88458.1 lipopolysaccharide biosynthesis protein [Kamptonema sp. SIO1D9]